jgi:hypothetical protein
MWMLCCMFGTWSWSSASFGSQVFDNLHYLACLTQHLCETATCFTCGSCDWTLALQLIWYMLHDAVHVVDANNSLRLQWPTNVFPTSKCCTTASEQ